MPDIPRASQNDLEASAMRAFGFSPDEELMPNVIADMVVQYQDSILTGELITPYVNPTSRPTLPLEAKTTGSQFARIIWNKTLNLLTPTPDDPNAPPSKLSAVISLAILAGGLVAGGFIVREVMRTYKAVKSA